jgi:hypothetical protein
LLTVDWLQERRKRTKKDNKKEKINPTNHIEKTSVCPRHNTKQHMPKEEKNRKSDAQ